MTRSPASHLAFAAILGTILAVWGVASWPSPIVTDHRIQGIERDWDGDRPRSVPPTPLSLAASAAGGGAVLLTASTAIIGFRLIRRVHL